MAQCIEEDFYGLLGVSPQAPSDEIKTVFTNLAKNQHPDRRRDSAVFEQFASCTRAYDVLRDPVKRAQYDLARGIIQRTPEERRRINKMKRQQAERELSMMEAEAKKIRDAESQAQGLIILEALYGDLSSNKVGATINVTVPLQCRVESSALFLQDHNSKSWLEGFYDPLDNGEPQLYVKYKFLGKLHECTIGDNDDLVIPIQEHAIPEEELEHKTLSFAERRRQKAEEEKKKSRRRWAFASALAVLLGVFLWKRNEFSNIRLQDGVQTAISPIMLLFGLSKHGKSSQSSSSNAESSS